MHLFILFNRVEIHQVLAWQFSLLVQFFVGKVTFNEYGRKTINLVNFDPRLSKFSPFSLSASLSLSLPPFFTLNIQRMKTCNTSQVKQSFNTKQDRMFEKQQKFVRPKATTYSVRLGLVKEKKSRNIFLNIEAITLKFEMKYVQKTGTV